jgi:broad specificity phosphatase PhoE
VGRLVLIRHGESEGNRNRLFTAHPHVPLTEEGRAQARRAGERVAKSFAPTQVVASPFLRARQTAAIIGEVLGLAVVVEEDLHERNYGELAGLPYDTVRAGYDPTEFWAWRPPGGETLVEAAARGGAVLDRLAASTPDADVVAVSHGALMVALWWHVTGDWRTATVVPNAGIVVVEHRAGAYLSARSVDDAT